MKKLIMIKYGELTTKKGNRGFFIRTLKNNILEKLSSFNPIIEEDFFRMFISVEDEYFDASLEKLKNIFGIHEIVIVEKHPVCTLEELCDYGLELISKETFKTFKVVTNRSDKNYPGSSMDISRKVGAHFLKNIKNIEVDVHNPEIIFNIEIRKEGIYLYTKSIKGLGGYPVGCLGKAMLMLSGGIDSVVAGYLTTKRGVALDYIYFESIPHTSLEARQKVIDLATILNNYGVKGRLFIVNFTKMQESIYSNLNSEYMITMMRRMMYRIGSSIAKREGCNALVNGESIGQVASQTLTSMRAVNEVTEFPIIRPLAAFDKLEIIEISKNIGSYDISIRPYEDCCTIFVPPHPIINPDLDLIHKMEENFEYEEMLKDCIDNADIYKFDKISDNEYL